MDAAHDHLVGMLTRLKLTAIRDQLDSLVDEAGRRELTIRERQAPQGDDSFAFARSREAWTVASVAAGSRPGPGGEFRHHRPALV
jgi:hypothetical protein